MDKNHKKGHNRKGFHLKKHRKADDSRSFDPRATTTNTETIDEKPVLFQLGSIASYGVSDVRLKPDPEITTTTTTTTAASRSVSLSSSSDNILDSNAKDRKSSLSFDSSRNNKELLSLSLKLCELQGSSDTPRSQVSGVTHASLEPTLIMSPSVQMMDREGRDQPQRNSLPTLEKNLSTVSNDSLFSLSIGDNAITRDELFSYRDFKAGELLKSSELLSFSPSVHVPVGSSDLGKSFDMDDDKGSGTLRDDSDDIKSLNSDISWRNIGECNTSDNSPSSSQSFSYPMTKKTKKKKKKKKLRKKNKKTTQQQQKQQQKPKKRCSWLCCKNTGPCDLSCCKWPSCDYDFSCFKRIKCCACCCMWPKCCCSWLFCCHWSCWGCCSSSSKKVIDDDDDEISRGSEEEKLQKGESKTCHKWFCCFSSCSTSLS